MFETQIGLALLPFVNMHGQRGAIREPSLCTWC